MVNGDQIIDFGNQRFGSCSQALRRIFVNAVKMCTHKCILHYMNAYLFLLWSFFHIFQAYRLNRLGWKPFTHWSSAIKIYKVWKQSQGNTRAKKKKTETKQHWYGTIYTFHHVYIVALCYSIFFCFFIPFA